MIKKNSLIKVRNILNHDEIQEFLIDLSQKFPESCRYINENIKNYLYNFAPIEIASAMKVSFYKMDHKNFQQFHLVVLSNNVRNNYQKALIYAQSHIDGYQNMAFNDVYMKYNSYINTSVFLNKVGGLGSIALIHQFSDGSELYQLLDKQSLLNEGYRMHNCVYGYHKKNDGIESEDLFYGIYSYRRAGESIMTIEMKNFKMAQCKLKFNQEVVHSDFPELFDFIRSKGSIEEKVLENNNENEVVLDDNPWGNFLIESIFMSGLVFAGGFVIFLMSKNFNF